MLNHDLKKEYFQTFLKDHSGNHELVGDYSDEMHNMIYKNTNNKKLFITRLDIMIEDNAKLKYNKYAAETVLKHGVKIYYIRDNVKHYIAGKEEPIKTNKDWLRYSCQVEQYTFNNNHSFLKVIFKFSNEDSVPIILKKDDIIGIELQDDYSSLENHTFHLNGFHIKI